MKTALGKIEVDGRSSLVNCSILTNECEAARILTRTYNEQQWKDPHKLLLYDIHSELCIKILI